MKSSNSSHFLLVPFLAWGHTRPICALAARMISENPNLLITIFAEARFLQKSRFEVTRQFDAESPIIKRIRILSIFRPIQGDLAKITEAFGESYAVAYETLAKAEPITCTETGTTFEAVPAPTALIIDHHVNQFVALPQLKASRALTGHSVPIIAWMSGAGSSSIRVWAPESLGGFGDFGAKAEAEAACVGRSLDDVAEELYQRMAEAGAVVRIPGLPPMYDYEFEPHKFSPMPPLASFVLIGGREFLLNSDAFLIASSDSYEKESLDGLRGWFAQMQRTLYAVGPLLPSNSTFRSDNDKNAGIEVFLDNILQAHGKHSLFFISFGTVFWPTDSPDYLEEVIEGFIEKKTPFILAHASPFANPIPAQLSEKINASNLGLLTSWSPQQFILQHPATGWFLTHGGNGSVTESLSSGVPMIFWPFQADQPCAAANVTENLKAGIELFEVRTGKGLRPIYRNGKTPKGTREAVGEEIRYVVDMCRGPEGEELRRNAERLKVEFNCAWEEGGSARLAMRQFLKDYA
ncbi:hypothetical protein H0H81_011177 [Sphagnurus paluster]|uniref:Glycosyltransferase family 1 protein n=1 Tax=Sphagnurus paluster TaxID=117069 RepID=A0A9P7KKM4_9AGAR|nr:hypothetical protein H0H81_011177 [Sphagnurus paluster]